MSTGPLTPWPGPGSRLRGLEDETAATFVEIDARLSPWRMLDVLRWFDRTGDRAVEGTR